MLVAHLSCCINKLPSRAAAGAGVGAGVAAAAAQVSTFHNIYNKHATAKREGF